MDTDTQTRPAPTADIPLKAAAERLGLNPVTLKRKVKDRKLAAYRDGAGRWMFASADLETFAASYLTPQPYNPDAA